MGRERKVGAASASPGCVAEATAGDAYAAVYKATYNAVSTDIYDAYYAKATGAVEKTQKQGNSQS